MGLKIFNYAWKNKKQTHFGRAGTKDDYAWDLIWMGNILLSEEDQKYLKVKGKKDIFSLSPRRCSKFLEKKGWKWVKLFDT
jgi:hypothetical protein